jgi:hypothetical protein
MKPLSSPALLSEFTIAQSDDLYAEYAFGRQFLGKAVTKIGRMTGSRNLARTLNTPVGTLASQGGVKLKTGLRTVTASKGAMKRLKNIRKIRTARQMQAAANPKITWKQRGIKYGRRAAVAGGVGAAGYTTIASSTDNF